MKRHVLRRKNIQHWMGLIARVKYLTEKLQNAQDQLIQLKSHVRLTNIKTFAIFEREKELEKEIAELQPIMDLNIEDKVFARRLRLYLKTKIQ